MASPMLMHNLVSNTAVSNPAMLARSGPVAASSRGWMVLSCIPVLVLGGAAVHIAATPNVAWFPVVAIVIGSLIALTIVTLRDRSRLLRATQLRELMPMAQPLPYHDRFPNMETQNLPAPGVVGVSPVMPHVGHAHAAQSVIRVT